MSKMGTKSDLTRGPKNMKPATVNAEKTMIAVFGNRKTAPRDATYARSIRPYSQVQGVRTRARRRLTPAPRVPSFAAIIGVSVNETSSEANVEAVTTIANGTKNRPAIVRIVAIGRNTTMFVSAEAATASATSPAPRAASPFRRAMFSRTTIEFATRMPTEMPTAFIVMMFAV